MQTIRQYKEVFDAFFEDKGLIPACRYHEVRFEELERDPVGQFRKVYQVLGLPDFGQVEPSVRRYVSSQAGYKKNAYPEITPETKVRIVRECAGASRSGTIPFDAAAKTSDSQNLRLNSQTSLALSRQSRVYSSERESL